MSDANARGVGQIFRAYQCFAAKTGEHQAHQFGAGCFDGEARGQRGGGIEIIYAAGFAIGLKQFLNRVAVRRSHRLKYAPGGCGTKGKVWGNGRGDRLKRWTVEALKRRSTGALQNAEEQMTFITAVTFWAAPLFTASPPGTRLGNALTLQRLNGLTNHASFRPRARAAIAGRNGRLRANSSNPVCL